MKRFSAPREYRRSKRRYDRISSLFRSGEASTLLRTMFTRGQEKPSTPHRARSLVIGIAVFATVGGLAYTVFVLLFQGA